MSVSVGVGYQIWSYHSWYTVFSLQSGRVYYASETGVCSWISLKNLEIGLDVGTHKLKPVYKVEKIAIKEAAPVMSDEEQEKAKKFWRDQMKTRNQETPEVQALSRPPVSKLLIRLVSVNKENGAWTLSGSASTLSKEMLANTICEAEYRDIVRAKLLDEAAKRDTSAERLMLEAENFRDQAKDPEIYRVPPPEEKKDASDKSSKSPKTV